MDACKANGMNENNKGGKVHSYEIGKERKKQMINRSTVGRGKEREKGMIIMCVCVCVCVRVCACVRNTYITCSIHSLAIN